MLRMVLESIETICYKFRWIILPALIISIFINIYSFPLIEENQKLSNENKILNESNQNLSLKINSLEKENKELQAKYDELANESVFLAKEFQKETQNLWKFLEKLSIIASLIAPFI
ncbi:Uncharacterised protein [uncultured archaeon]|nr:Uncharacterised protein [uncultured archaeon]